MVLNRAIFKVTGVDAARYLNGQLTNDVLSLDEGHSIFSFVCDAKGKILGELWVRQSSGGVFYLDVDVSQRESLFLRLSRYLIADDAEIEDVSDSLQMVLADEEKVGGLVDLALSSWVTPRYGEGVKEYLVPVEEVERSPLKLQAGLQERQRVQAGFPGWGSELSLGLLPAETGLVPIAVSFTKGCYTGQEVVSRMKTAGKVNKLLVKIKLSEEASATELLNSEGEAVGEITSSIGLCGIALLKVRKVTTGEALKTSDGVEVSWLV